MKHHFTRSNEYVLLTRHVRFNNNHIFHDVLYSIHKVFRSVPDAKPRRRSRPLVARLPRADRGGRHVVRNVILKTILNRPNRRHVRRVRSTHIRGWYVRDLKAPTAFLHRRRYTVSIERRDHRARVDVQVFFRFQFDRLFLQDGIHDRRERVVVAPRLRTLVVVLFFFFLVVAKRDSFSSFRGVRPHRQLFSSRATKRGYYLFQNETKVLSKPIL